MEGCDGNLDGSPGELTFRRYRPLRGRRGEAHLGRSLCRHRGRPGHAATDHAERIHCATRSRMVADCRKAHREANGDDSDLVIGLQLTHSGRYSRRPILATHDPLLDPRTIADKTTGRKVDAELSAHLRRRNLNGSSMPTSPRRRLARDVGFDFVDVKQCHRYLLSELLGARNRPGPYGGSYENRTRLPREIIQAIRAGDAGHVDRVADQCVRRHPVSQGR